MEKEFTCPKCGSQTIQFVQGDIRCGACGEQEKLPAGIRLHPAWPSRWLTVNYLESVPGGFETCCKDNNNDKG